MTSALQALQQTLNTNLEKFQTVQRELQKAQQGRQQLSQQKNENEMVLDELNRLPDDAAVYKLIGPALIKQDPVEAKSNVRKRIEYISGEVSRSDNQVRTMESKMTEYQKEIVGIQKKIQNITAKKGGGGKSG